MAQSDSLMYVEYVVGSSLMFSYERVLLNPVLTSRHTKVHKK